MSFPNAEAAEHRPPGGPSSGSRFVRAPCVSARRVRRGLLARGQDAWLVACIGASRSRERVEARARFAAHTMGFSRKAAPTKLTRSKDPLRNLIPPARTAPPGASSSRRTTQNARQAWRTEAVLGDMAKGLHALDGGDVVVRPRPQANMTRADQGEMERLQEVAGSFKVKGCLFISLPRVAGSIKRCRFLSMPYVCMYVSSGVGFSLCHGRTLPRRARRTFTGQIEFPSAMME